MRKNYVEISVINGVTDEIIKNVNKTVYRLYPSGSPWLAPVFGRTTISIYNHDLIIMLL